MIAVGDTVAYRGWQATVLKVYRIPQTRTSEIDAASVRTHHDNRVWASIPLTRLEVVA